MRSLSTVKSIFEIFSYLGVRALLQCQQARMSNIHDISR
jgi:hypothetical protein